MLAENTSWSQGGALGVRRVEVHGDDEGLDPRLLQDRPVAGLAPVVGARAGGQQRGTVCAA